MPITHLVAKLFGRCVLSFFEHFVGSGYFIFFLFLPFFGFLVVFWLQGIFAELGSDGGPKRYYLSTSLLATIVCAGSVAVSFVLSTSLLFFVTYSSTPNIIVSLRPSSVSDWLCVDYLLQNFTFQFDALSAVMLFVISSISLLVHLYSLAYLGFDPYFMRFVSFLNLFTFFMMFLVSSGNLVQIFIGWEGVGLSSYLLINFWHTRLEANKSALKAIILNRIGDVALLMAVVVSLYAFGTTSLASLFTIVENLSFVNAPYFSFFGLSLDVVTVLSWLLLLAAVAKSAQLGLHTWLPDAMEGPTPVSALLHAATMVTAGVYLVVRFSYFFEHTPSARAFCIIIGSLTVVFGSLTALVQFDIKKIIAFSTTSQLGYMFVACGLSGYHIAMYHLVTHAFFKALLFLVAGVIIHNLNNEQDIRKMGRLIYFSPLTYLLMLTGFFSLSGVPFLGGFFSKDAIIELSYAGKDIFSYYGFLSCLLAAFLTACYSMRVLYHVFFSDLRISGSYKGSFLRPSARFESGQIVNDISVYNTAVLLPLFFGSVFSGYVLFDSFAGIGSTFWGSSICFSNSYSVVFYEFLVPSYVKVLPILASALGYTITFFIYAYFGGSVDHFFCALRPSTLAASKFRQLYSFFVKKWFFDIVYNKFFVSYFLRLSRALYVQLDKGYLEHLGPYGISKCCSLMASLVRKSHASFEFYLLLVLLFLLAVILFVFVR